MRLGVPFRERFERDIQDRWLADGSAPREFGWFAEVAQDALDLAWWR